MKKQASEKQADKKHTANELKALFWQLVRFGLVGVTAGLVHFVVAWLFSQQVSLLLANCYGFFTAFWVSFFGHYYISFQIKQKLTLTSVLRFLGVALLGFLCNQAIVVILAWLTPLDKGVILAIAIVMIAMLSFILSRWYAFNSEIKDGFCE